MEGEYSVMKEEGDYILRDNILKLIVIRDSNLNRFMDSVKMKFDNDVPVYLIVSMTRLLEY